MKVIEFVLDEPTILLNKFINLHFAQRSRMMEELAWKVAAATVGKRPAAPMQRCRIHVDRYSTVLPDWDGLYGGLKSLLDVLCVRGQPNQKGHVTHAHGLGFIVDDNPRCIISLTATPKACKKGGGHTRVTIVEAAT